MKARATTVQFSGSYLNRLWTRRFILGSILQHYEPAKEQQGAAVVTHRTGDAAQRDDKVDQSLLRAQRILSEAWEMPVKMMDSVSEQRIYRLLSKYASCEGMLSDEALEEMEKAVSLMPGAPKNLADPREMEALLCAVGYHRNGDNLHRVSFSGQLTYSPEAHGLMNQFLSGKLQRDGGDVYDAIRERHPGPGYAIDSATTSEVDDAIGVEVSPTGEEWFTVFVSDATVYCPYDSGLEHITARALGTTTYLPEGVFFMLPKPIVEAATLREDKPCRTFNIRFQVGTSGEIKNYSVSVGWLEKLRRLTYEQMQAIVTEAGPEIDGEGTRTTGEAVASPPSWLRQADEEALKRIYKAAVIRFTARMQHAERSGTPPLDGGLPDPYIKVDGTQVVELRDQILSTQEARLAVAELMIAANEACSRIAQANSIPIPYRGTRSLSSNHEAAQYFQEPQGVELLHSLDSSHTFLAESMQKTIRRLSAVTRAMYHPTPLYHAGLLTHHYTHSTSPLRRYPDMLVHHQLKVWLHGQKKKANKKLSLIPFFEQYIPEYTMATHCASISLKQERSALLQDKSTRYWILRQMEKLVKAEKGLRTFLCFVGETKNVAGSPEYERFHNTFNEAVAAVSNPIYPPGGDVERFMQRKREFTYVSQIYIPEVQMTHTIHHSCNGAKVGAVVECRVLRIRPTQGVLEMSVVAVKEEGDERYFERVLRGGIISHIDA
eukprot:gene10670-7414_t